MKPANFPGRVARRRKRAQARHARTLTHYRANLLPAATDKHKGYETPDLGEKIEVLEETMRNTERNIANSSVPVMYQHDVRTEQES